MIRKNPNHLIKFLCLCACARVCVCVSRYSSRKLDVLRRRMMAHSNGIYQEMMNQLVRVWWHTLLKRKSEKTDFGGKLHNIIISNTTHAQNTYDSSFERYSWGHNEKVGYNVIPCFIEEKHWIRFFAFYNKSLFWGGICFCAAFDPAYISPSLSPSLFLCLRVN